MTYSHVIDKKKIGQQPKVYKEEGYFIKMYLLLYVPLMALASAETLIFQPHSRPVESVTCPDGSSECPTGNTCCKETTGDYGCCPLPNAVCCNDEKHCCPAGHTCKLESSTCSKGKLFFPWIERFPKKKKIVQKCDPTDGNCKKESEINITKDEKKQELKSIVLANTCPADHKCISGQTCCKSSSGQYGCCPLPKKVKCDETHECPSGQTCCKLKSGQFGCCPLPDAVCCSDGQHCCPSGYTCNVGSGTCQQANGISMKWLEKQPALKSTAVAVICPDGQHQCQDGETCCKLSNGQYGCCPIPNAVCCSDNQHCCPSGTTCDVGSGKCNSANGISMDWLMKQPALKSAAVAVTCPDGQHQCENGQTCCKLSSGQYGCCPIPNAVCCSDGQHCCPSGYTCNVGSGTCQQANGISMKWLEKQPALKSTAVAVICPDGQHQCQDGETCCKLSNGQYGCCPIPNAVCCSDGHHCCPSGYTCNVASGTCQHANGISMEWLEKRPALKSAAVAVICPDGEHQCQDGQTCCKLSSGHYGCCPIPNAVCCSDGQHCCPSGYTCNVGSGTCQQANGISMKWLEKQPALKSAAVAVTCPDGQHQCENGQTCCKLSSGQYGCCPIPNAVCCSDGQHCCPSGYTCNVGSGTCQQANGISMKWLEKQPALKSAAVAVTCPDGQHQCENGQTCCKLSSGQYGCCPIPNAVCCSDGQHCCPSGYTCNVGSGTCQQSNGISMKWLEKQPALKSAAVAVTCPDGQHQCENGQTCCKLSSGQYGCCPIPNAVCCSDGQHCCPSGYTCNVGSGTCQQANGISMKWLEKQPALKSAAVAVTCPDGQHQCENGQTCCKLSSGQYGCCPIPNAVCCSDGQHCCPSGYTCNVGSGTCQQANGISMKWLEKQPALKSAAVAVICPDGQHQCQDGQTCCKLSSGQYGCCPKPNAVCCSDNQHCCPSGTTCDVGSGKCNSANGISMDWLMKQPALKSAAVAVTCPDGQHQCENGQTCCKLSSGQYGCCPIPNAVCCSDGQHCCPSGYTCNVGSGTCQHANGISMEWLEKQPALKSADVAVICPDGEHHCQDGQTCCKLSSGQYGCCPIPNAVCCSDGHHCCPSGYTCNVASGTCQHANGISMEWLEKQPALKSVDVAVICPDGEHQCQDGQTCCKLSSGQYGCCPIPNAVCCSDGHHCCPSGYTCNVASGTCQHANGISMEWLEKQPALKSAAVAVICPDGEHQCQDGQTCCKQSSGQYGCCPIPNAVCCSDGHHCCPTGYTCNVASGTCQHANGISMEWLEKQPALKSVDVAVICPDGEHQCQDGQTCCKLSSGQYGCCPIPNAVCCSDGHHCCPSGYTCNVTSGTCHHANGISMEWLEKQPALKSTAVAVICPDGEHQCEDGQTCCKLSNGQYGCCPVPKAICCSDGQHCCPSGSTCDLLKSKCDKANGISMDWFEKQPALKSVVAIVVSPNIAQQCLSDQTYYKLSSGQYGCCPTPNELKESNMKNVICPDKKYTCKPGSTCCKMPSGSYGCCAFPMAACCSDGKHCCPSGSRCDPAHGKCLMDNGMTMDWLEKQPAVMSASIVCPDESICQSGQTCCKRNNVKYACCPTPNAVCCSDGLHCCPEGTQCDVSSGKCHRQVVTTDLVKHHLVMVSAIRNNICPDGIHVCPEKHTCCKQTSGKYSCCPIEKAVCCSDGVHCCPSGFSCNMAKKRCEKAGVTMDWFMKLPARKHSVSSVICADGRSSCPDGQTCCKLASGEYGCCPVKNAVCCADKVHCCPQNHHCNASACIPDDLAVTSLVTISRSSSVMCPDGQSECQDGQTCCKLASGAYGCCNIEDAVCCSDHIHCCPKGYICDLVNKKCISQNLTLSKEVVHLDVLPVQQNYNRIICNNGHTCPEGNTCCRTDDNQYTCCDYPKAVCCDNGKSCCPEGNECGHKKCKPKTDVVTSIKLLTADEAQRISKVGKRFLTCPDGVTNCPEENTCCMTKEGNYKCCAYSQAICCKQADFCCPHGYICDEEPYICRQPDYTKIFLQKILKSNNQN